MTIDGIQRAVTDANLEELLRGKDFVKSQINALYNGKTLLFQAAEKGHVVVCALLLEWRADPKILSGDEMSAPLHAAAEKGHIDVASCIRDQMERGDIDIRSGTGNTPLHHAARGGHVGMVTWLLDQGADRQLRNTMQAFPVDIAQNFGHQRVIVLLQPVGDEMVRAPGIEGDAMDIERMIRSYFPYLAGAGAFVAIGGTLSLIFPSQTRWVRERFMDLARWYNSFEGAEAMYRMGLMLQGHDRERQMQALVEREDRRRNQDEGIWGFFE
ncbi:MAG: ankyrin repeat domain-containing protein [Verrucomicrobia bacterium]|nr:ankyrin repeat domain-containing protein [Verrucomicrobiota bacterium]